MQLLEYKTKHGSLEEKVRLYEAEKDHRRPVVSSVLLSSVLLSSICSVQGVGAQGVGAPIFF